MAGRTIVRQRCVLLLGRSGVGKSTVANHLVGHDPLSPDEPPFRLSNNPSCGTREAKHETVEFMWENDLYRVTVVDTVGIFDTHISGNDIIFDNFVQYNREKKLRIDLILFVFRKGRFTAEEKGVFSFITAKFREKHIVGCPKDVSPISALVVTGCEIDDTTTREQLVQHFKVDHDTREIASQMGMGIYPVGFPPLHKLIPALRDCYKSGVERDRDTLRELIVRVNADREREAEKRRYLAACERAMKEKGSVEQIAMHCVFLGLPRSGKSSLIQRLLGKHPSVSCSTGVAEKVVRVEIRKSTAHVSGMVWSELEDLDDEAVLVMHNVSSTAPVDVAALTTDDPVELQPGKALSVLGTAFSLSGIVRNLFTRAPRTKQHTQGTFSPPDRQSLVKPKSPGKQGVKPPLDTFRDAFQKKGSKLKKLIGEPWMLYITDTGGQPEFQELLPILVSGPSLFFLVFSLHLELNKRFQVEYITSRGKAAVPYEAGLTVLEMLLQSLATIASTSVFRMVGGKKVIIQPNIFFVATHKDLVSDEHLHQVDSTLQEVVKGTEAYKNGMVRFASESRMILAVNNLSEGNEDVEQIRAAVERIGRQTDDYRVKTPFSWLMFSNIMQQMKSPVLKYKQCYSVAQQCGIDTHKEMNDALRFLHENVGVVRYYHDVSDLRGFVIKDPQYIFDVITDLIVATFTFDRSGKALHEQFTKKGIFPLDVFERLARSTEFLPPSKLITLLQHLNIVALLKKDGASRQYFMPCALAHSESSTSTTSSSTPHIPPLLIVFKSGYCPKGLFGALVVYLLQNKMNSKLEWELEQDKIFRDQICLSIGPYDSFQLKVHPAFLSVELCASSGASKRRRSLANICGEVQRCISSAIDEVSETLHCSRKAAFSFGFFCPENVDTDPSPHPATVKFLDGQPCNLRCALTRKRLCLPDSSLVWFGEDSVTPESGVATSAASYSEPCSFIDPDEYTGLNYDPKNTDLLNEVAAEIPTLWREIGLELGLADHHLDCIETEQNRKQIRCFGEVLRSWREQQTAPYTWETIIRALQTKAVGQYKLAQTLKKKFTQR